MLFNVPGGNTSDGVPGIIYMGVVVSSSRLPILSRHWRTISGSPSGPRGRTWS